MTAPGSSDEELERVLDAASELADSPNPALSALGQRAYDQAAQQYKAQTPPSPSAPPPT